MTARSTGPSDRDLVALLLDRIASDAAFRRQLLDEPASVLAALRGKSPEVDEEVSGYSMCVHFTCKVSCAGRPTCHGTCAVTEH